MVAGRRAGWAIPVIAVTVAAALLFASTASARLRVVDHFFDRAGDYALYVLRDNGRIKFEIRQFPFRGTYKLCVKPPRHPVECHLFRFHRKGPIFVSRVDFARHFPHRFRGRYRVGWTVDGFHLRKSLHFRKR
jgi:hypothetical protein